MPLQQLIDIGDGYPATRETLKIMAGVSRQAAIDPVIRDLSVRLTSRLQNKAFTAEVNALFQWIQQNIRYVADPTPVLQYLEYPVNLLQSGAGNCVNMCTLLSALLESIGHPTRFCAVGYVQPGQFEHVYLETRIGNQWVGLDPTEDVDIGWCPVRPYVDQECRAMLKVTV